MENNSGKGIQFGFGKSDAENREQKVDKSNSPVEGTQPVNKQDKPEEDLEEEYTDRRTITISLVKNYSLYRKVNDKVLPKRKDYIGGSIKSSRTLSSNKEEVDTYFPNIIGLSPNDPNFISRVKQYLNNIRIPVDELGRTFDISFHYFHKKDYYKIKAEEEKIEEVYQSANRQNIKNLREALNEKINRLHILESTKCRLGYPINVDEYLMYRHCLLYNDVAKDVALINSDSNIRFYFKDDQKEAEKLRKYRLEVNKAKANYVACLADNDLFDAIYTQYCVQNSLPVISSLAKDRLEREIEIDKFSTNEPIKFNKIFNNKDIRLIANIEKLVARGELIRSQYNQNISTPDGEFIGANIGEAVSYFKNPENTSIVNAFINKLKNI
ncbi:MAG: hypothetical protein [Bacteriophage sp.]|jgi:hypothetical protein|nr:MAG: hypothetical protein [Bacteriophage sp.]